MGLQMDDIHTPTVPSGPTTRYGPHDSSKQESVPLNDLIAQKERVESELSALSSVLDSHGVNMNTSLTTFDGFPRNDLDVAQIRTTRARIIRLRNDYKGLMSRIEAGLHAYHASLRNSSNPTASDCPSANSISSHNSSPPSVGLVEAPFAKVNSVIAGSPADKAGLKAGDQLRRFGNVNWMNHEKLSKVAETVSRNEGLVINVAILRRGAADGSSEELQLQLIPRQDWGGRGMLGCHLLPA